jgi:hypothetical protein
MQSLDVGKLGIAFGVAWSLFTFLAGLTAAGLSWGVEFIQLLGTIYYGYGPTLMGSVIGAVWGFVNGFLWGAVIAGVYNYLL